MLKHVDPLLSAELLFVLASMGHGDEIAVVDANFPAASLGRKTVHGRPVPLVGADAPGVVRAILSVIPLDRSGGGACRRMATEDSGPLPGVQQAVADIVRSAEPSAGDLTPLDRFAYYDAATSAYAIVQTGEHRLYGCFLFRKGVIEP